MANTIQIELKRLTDIHQMNEIDSRREQLAQQKKAIYAYRNQRLANYFKIQVNEESIAQAEQGKPYLVDYPKYAFNHSHTRNVYALAMSQQIQDIGVDLEEMSRKVRFEALAQHAFHPEELRQWQALDYAPEYWFKVWTTKEAVLKASGLGIRINLNELNTQIQPNQDGGCCQHPEIGFYAYRNYMLAGCVLTVAWQSEQDGQGGEFPQIQIYQSV